MKPTAQIIGTPSLSPKSPVIIGYSVEGRPIEVFQMGTGPNAIVLVGGIHGGYETNTVILLRQIITRLQASTAIPPDISVYIIPAMNPDGQEKEKMAGRVNANGVDLNRNWGCDWIGNEGYYYGQYYNTGSEAFSEPETQHVHEFILSVKAVVTVFYHSRGEFIFYGECSETFGSKQFAEFMSNATGYPLYNPPASFGDAEQTPITGDATNYLDSIGIRAIGIELSSHDVNDVDLERNYTGVLATFDFVREIASQNR